MNEVSVHGGILRGHIICVGSGPGKNSVKDGCKGFIFFTFSCALVCHNERWKPI